MMMEATSKSTPCCVDQVLQQSFHSGRPQENKSSGKNKVSTKASTKQSIVGKVWSDCKFIYNDVRVPKSRGKGLEASHY